MSHPVRFRPGAVCPEGYLCIPGEVPILLPPVDYADPNLGVDQYGDTLTEEQLGELIMSGYGSSPLNDPTMPSYSDLLSYFDLGPQPTPEAWYDIGPGGPL